MKSFDLLGSENGVFVNLNLGVFPNPVREGGRGDAVLFLDVSISFTGLIESNDGFLKFLAVLCGAVFVRHVCFSFLFFLVSYSNTLVHFFRIHPIEELVRDFPETKDSFEYRDYISKLSKGTASGFISRAIDDNVDLIGKRENYVSYIAKRPRTERHGAHGLFTDADVPINLSKVAEEVANHEGNVRTHIISLRREDAARLGYDNAYAWRNLLRS